MVLRLLLLTKSSSSRWDRYLGMTAAMTQESVPVTNVCDFGYLYNRGTVVTCDDAAVLVRVCIHLSALNAMFSRS